MTGGAVRVGRAIALALARAGMDVAIGYHRSAGEARRAVAEAAATGARATATPAQYDRHLDLNLRGAFFCSQAAARVMARGGHIVNISDAAAGRVRPTYIPYQVSKAGIESLTRGLAGALSARRIAVNCVAPGAVLRPRGFSPARWRRVTRGHAGSVGDVAASVLFFVTCPRYITGSWPSTAATAPRREPRAQRAG